MKNLIGFKGSILDSIIEYELENGEMPDVDEIGFMNGIEPSMVRMYLTDLRNGGFIFLDGNGQPIGLIRMIKAQGVKRDACD